MYRDSRCVGSALGNALGSHDVLGSSHNELGLVNALGSHEVLGSHNDMLG